MSAVITVEQIWHYSKTKWILILKILLSCPIRNPWRDFKSSPQFMPLSASTEVSSFFLCNCFNFATVVNKCQWKRTADHMIISCCTQKKNPLRVDAKFCTIPVSELKSEVIFYLEEDYNSKQTRSINISHPPAFQHLGILWAMISYDFSL